MQQKSLTNTETVLLDLLKGVLSENVPEDTSTDTDWELLIEIADKHSVLSLLYDVLAPIECIPKALLQKTAGKSRQIVLQNYRLLFFSSRILQELSNAGIAAILLKGWQTARLYPIPEARKSGDIDILIPDTAQFAQAVSILENTGLRKEDKQFTNHHIVFTADHKFHIELHSMLTEPFEQAEMNTRINAVLPEYYNNIVHKEILGYPISCAAESYDAYYLLVHMLQHFLRAGFGLKLLCDWCVFWKRPLSKEEKSTFLRLVRSTHIENFAKAVTSLCVLYFGLPYDCISFLFENAPFEQTILQKGRYYTDLMKEILEAEEFGHSSQERMVILQNSGLSGYLQEFHHQMKLNNPNSKHILLWPYLWIRTLIIFLMNNRKIRKTSTKSIFQKAAQRSRLIRDMKLFEK